MICDDIQYNSKSLHEIDALKKEKNNNSPFTILNYLVEAINYHTLSADWSSHFKFK